MHSVVLFLILLTSCGHLFTADKAVTAKDSYSLSQNIPLDWKIHSANHPDYLLHGPAGASLLIQSFCNEFQASSLDSLAKGTFNSLDKSRISEQNEFMLHDRTALKTKGEAYMDGIKIKLTLINTKRNHCYYDILEILPHHQTSSIIDEVVRGIRFK